MRCPYCGCEGMIKNGHTAIGTQRYTCKYCGKKFTYYKPLTIEQKRVIALYCIQGSINSTELAKHLKISRVQVREYIRQYRTKSEKQNGESTNINAGRIS